MKYRTTRLLLRNSVYLARYSELGDSLIEAKRVAWILAKKGGYPIMFRFEGRNYLIKKDTF